MRKPTVSDFVTLTTHSRESLYVKPVIEPKKLYGFFVLCWKVTLTSERCPAVVSRPRRLSRVASRDVCALAGTAVSSSANTAAAILHFMPCRWPLPAPYVGAYPHAWFTAKGTFVPPQQRFTMLAKLPTSVTRLFTS